VACGLGFGISVLWFLVFSFASVQFIPNYMRERSKCAKCRKANIIACLGLGSPDSPLTIAVYIHDFCIIFSTKHGNFNLRHTLFSSSAA